MVRFFFKLSTIEPKIKIILLTLPHYFSMGKGFLKHPIFKTQNKMVRLRKISDLRIYAFLLIPPSISSSTLSF